MVLQKPKCGGNLKILTVTVCIWHEADQLALNLKKKYNV